MLDNYFNLKDDNVIKVYKDNSCSMAMVEVNDDCVMMGNFHDFHNGCHGMWNIDDFNGYNHLVSLIKDYISKNGKSYKVHNINWNYERWDREQQIKVKEILFQGTGIFDEWEKGFVITSNNHLEIYEYYPNNKPDKVSQIHNKYLSRLLGVLQEMKGDGLI